MSLVTADTATPRRWVCHHHDSSVTNKCQWYPCYYSVESSRSVIVHQKVVLT